MFRQLTGDKLGRGNTLFLEHPSVLVSLLETAWRGRVHIGDRELGSPYHRSNIPQLPPLKGLGALLSRGDVYPDFFFIPDPLKGLVCNEFSPRSGEREVFSYTHAAGCSGFVLWDHLIYAYMIENTRVYEIFRRVVEEFAHGEKLGVPTPAAQHWLRNTEELFYSNPVPLTIMDVTSHIRADMRAARRNAYYRMFGMDLNHGADDGKPYPYVRAGAYNNEFVSTFEEFLREAWIAISNKENTSGPNPTDRGKVRSLVRTLRNMLLVRRQNGNLSREEFVHVATMSWFHLTLLHNFPIVEALKAEAASPEQRLFKIAQRVGLPAHGFSYNYFEIADAISKILIYIEAGWLSSDPAADAPLFTKPVESALNTIITHWSVITGRDVKATKVAVR